MFDLLKRILNKVGVDRAIAYSSGSRMVAGVAGVLSVFFISTFLTGIEQGFYYTFGSILALQVFFELGLTGIMTQYVAHEAAHLSLNSNSEYEGEERYRSRLSSLVHFCAKWYFVIAVLVLIVLSVVGFIYFGKYGDGQVSDVSWRLPWILVCVGTAIKLFQSPFISIFQGLGKVKEMSKIGFWQQVIIPVSTWIGLACGLKLYVIGIGYILSVIVWQSYVWGSGLIKIVLNLWKTRITERVSYMEEIFPYQWKIALSWVSGYFIFQLFNPVLFATEGAVVAGQMGMTMQGLSAIQALSLSWMNTKVPLYSSLIELKNYSKLDDTFNRTLKQMASVCSVLLLMFFSLIVLLNVTQFKIGDTILADRFLGYLPLAILMIPVFIQQYMTSWATYLRCHKQEPFLLISICCGITCCLSTLVLGKFLGLYGIILGYCCIQVLSVPWGYKIFRRKKSEWHK